MTTAQLLQSQINLLPAALQAAVGPRLTDFLAALAAQNIMLPPSDATASLMQAWASSEFVLGTSLRHPDVIADLLNSGDLDRDYDPDHYIQRLTTLAPQADNSTQLASLLRRFRRREMVRIAWRDLTSRATLESTLNELSWLAQACVQVAVSRSQEWLSVQFGQPLGHNGRPMTLVVLGMGKLGAYELNFSSDIDLIYAYPEDGETQGAARSLSHSEFFVRVGRSLTALLNDQTADGYVFRVDTRLRPFGNSGQLALSFDAMESYYERHGREWERYAMIKARPIAGDEVAAAELMARLKPFIYRRYLDFGAFDSLREMKQMIATENARKGMEENVKLGAGGIREIEFIGQAFQLIRGGREKALQERSILKILAQLASLGILPTYATERLTRAYHFLRRTENRLQAYADQQTHVLPKGDLERLRLAYSMDFPDWVSFMTALQKHTRLVHAQFDQTFEAPQAAAPQADDIETLWAGILDEHSAAAALTRANFTEPGKALSVLNELRSSAACRALTPKGKERLDRLMPLLIRAVGGSSAPDACLPRIALLIETIARRTSYLALLVEYPMALSQLVQLSAASSWIAQLLTGQPILLDELLDPRRLYAAPNAQELNTELDTRLSAVDQEDTEQQMEVLRQFKQANVLRAAACELTGALATTVISDQLTFVAESSLRAAIAIATHHLQNRHGQPHYHDHDQTSPAGFAVIAYGKLGGYELGFSSDLDLVFLHDSHGEHQVTNGPKPVENAVFFARLGQRIIHLLSTATAAGVLYEVDTRLRPSGKSGLLVSNIESYAHYQRTEAWTWEHQALVRARAIGGSSAIAAQFMTLRKEVLCRQRDEATLRAAVRDMRERMRGELSQDTSRAFDLKQGIGGTVDIEFIIQYLVLLHAHHHPHVTEYPDNLRTIDALTEANLLPPDDAKMLAHAYVSYRHAMHALALQQQPILAHGDAFAEMRTSVIRAWKNQFEQA